MSDDACVVGENPSNVDKKGGGRPAGSGSCGDERHEPCGIQEVKCDGEREAAVV